MSTMINIQDVGKKYKLQGTAPYLSLREMVSTSFQKNGKKHSNEEFWALQHINMTVEKGDRIGIIGRNGARKSTLLKILSRITPPTKGKIIIEGRVGMLL